MLKLTFAFLLFSLQAVSDPERKPSSVTPSSSIKDTQSLGEIETQIQHVKENLNVAKKNLDTLETEVRELDNLEKDHQVLQKKYKSYLSNAANEKKKNSKSLEELEEVEKKTEADKNEKSESIKADLDSVRQEKTDRQNWNRDAQSKTEKVQSLMKGLEDNIRQIEVRRQVRRDQLEEWERKEQEYQKLLVDLQKEKGDVLSEYNKYGVEIRKIIQSHFDVYAWQQKKPMEAVIYIELNPDGHVKTKKLIKKSADAAYDASVMKAVEDSDPFPVPSNIALLQQGIKLKFWSKN